MAGALNYKAVEGGKETQYLILQTWGELPAQSPSFVTLGMSLPVFKTLCSFPGECGATHKHLVLLLPELELDVACGRSRLAIQSLSVLTCQLCWLFLALLGHSAGSPGAHSLSKPPGDSLDCKLALVGVERVLSFPSLLCSFPWDFAQPSLKEL